MYDRLRNQSGKRGCAAATDNVIVKREAHDAAGMFSRRLPITIHSRRPTTEVSRAFRVWLRAGKFLASHTLIQLLFVHHNMMYAG
jgi:hypothetical protein